MHNSYWLANFDQTSGDLLQVIDIGIATSMLPLERFSIGQCHKVYTHWHAPDLTALHDQKTGEAHQRHAGKPVRIRRQLHVGGS